MASATLVARVAPPVLLGTGRARRLVERNLMVYRRTWLIIFSGFFEPFFYLLSIGVGVGALVGHVVGPGGKPVDYRAFVAPALLAASAMNGAIYDSTMNVFFKLKYAKTYDAVLATPVGVGDVAVGEITWALLRGLLYSATFLIIMAALGDVKSWWGVFALPAAGLIGFGFAAVGMAFTSFMRSWQDFDFVQLAILPLFLFSTTFYPLSTYPRWLQLVVECTPLFHGVTLIRSLTTGYVSPRLLWDAAYLFAMGLIGLSLSTRRLERLLLT
jgi:lipooligosaccharide transport system permease protein